VAKIVAFIEQRLACDGGQGIREAIAEVQLRGVARALAIVSIGASGDPHLLLVDRDNRQLKVGDEPVQST
jgi:hypothetical protein